MNGPGGLAEDYDAPLFVAWQLTNGCDARCLACCEDSGPQHAWSDELTRAQSVAIARAIVAARVPYVAFGGGEPLGVAHCWELFEILTAGGVALKLETNGRHIDDAIADRLAALAVDCVQISVDGAAAATHESARPGSSFAAAIAAILRLVRRGQPPQWVFVPTRLNLHEIGAAYDMAAVLGCAAFVTGPLMQLGRAAADWDRLACSAAQWECAVADLRARAASQSGPMTLSIYPWDIVTDLERRLESPQAMILIVPNGKVKLFNALPFSVADLRHETIAQAWRGYLAGWRAPQVRSFVAACRTHPTRLLNANATWTINGA